MELTPSDRPRPKILRPRSRSWWKQRSLWIVVILFAIFMALAAWSVYQLYFSEAGEPPAPGAARPALPAREKTDPDSDFADTQRVWAA